MAGEHRARRGGRDPVMSGGGPPRAGLELPAPDAGARAHGERVLEAVRAAIEASPDRQIGFDEYMNLVLHRPGIGYYQAGQARFGSAGDFVTAPSVSPLFGALVAAQIAELYPAAGTASVLELGAGDGALAESVLVELEQRGAAPARYQILEPSADLMAQQQRRLAALGGRCSVAPEWLTGLPAQPIDGVVLANEVLDALPVRCFLRGAGPRELSEITVRLEAGALASGTRPADEALRAAVAAIEADIGARLPAGYASEVSPLLPGWVAALAEVLERGLILLSDYGYTRREYYHPERASGTLICHYRHRAHEDPLRYPGLQDISASVDFSAVAEAAGQAGLEVLGFTSQAAFLLGCGLDEVLARRRGAGEAAWLEACRQAKLLTLPSEMGERFKFIALGRGTERPLRGFRFSQQLGRL